MTDKQLDQATEYIFDHTECLTCRRLLVMLQDNYIANTKCINDFIRYATMYFS